MKFPDPERAREILDHVHMSAYVGVVRQEYFSTLVSFLFVFGALASVGAAVLLLLKKDRHYVPVLTLCVLMSSIVTFTSSRGMKIPLPEGEALRSRAEKAVRGLEVMEKKVLHSLGKDVAVRVVRLDIEIGENRTSLDTDELRTRLMFLLTRESRYYSGDGFHADPEALQKEFEAMDLKVEGSEPNHLKVRSVRQTSDGSFLFSVDVL